MIVAIMLMQSFVFLHPLKIGMSLVPRKNGKRHCNLFSLLITGVSILDVVKTISINRVEGLLLLAPVELVYVCMDPGIST